MGAITEPTIWDYNGWMGGDRTVRLRPGELSQDTVDVFTRGHCHSMALALCELLPDAALMGVWCHGMLEHVFVQLPDGWMLDAEGLTDDESRIATVGLTEGEIDVLDYEELESLEEMEAYRRSRIEDALPFARALIEREGVGQTDLALAA